VKLITIVLILLGPTFLLSNWNRNPTNINNTTYYQNLHQVCGHDALVRIGDILYALTPYHSNREALWKSMDSGESWNMYWHNNIGSFSSSLIRGKNGFIYLFYRENGHINMLKFHFLDQAPPSSVVIASPPGSSSHGLYFNVTSTVDSEGRLFVAYSSESATISLSDDIYVTVSNDEGSTWSSQQIIKFADSDDSFYHPHLAAAYDDEIYCVVSSFQNDPREMWVLRSTDHGVTWPQDVLINSGVIVNPHILTRGNDELWVFAQSKESAYQGLVYNRSLNNGVNWTGWTLIDSTCGYADPTAALLDDSTTIVVSFRGDNGTGQFGTLCGESCRQRIAMSSDLGITWSIPQYLDSLEQVGTQSRLRYQTWFSGGGVLEYSWMQYEGNSTRTPIYYNKNIDLNILNSTRNDTGAYPPVILNIPNQTITEGDTFESILLDSFVIDPDHSNDQIIWTFSGNNELNVSINQERVALINLPTINWNGSEAIRFKATDPEGLFDEDTVTFLVTPISGFFAGNDLIPSTYILAQNFPNPFNPNTKIKYGLPKTTNLKIEIYNLLGQRISKLVDSQKKAGYHEVKFDATHFSSGVYIFILQSREIKIVKKMVLIK